MALQSQSPAAHNSMLGTKIRHPLSTNFDEEFESPDAKRVKRVASTDSSLARKQDSEDEEANTEDVRPRREIPDSEADSGDEDEADARPVRTDLEVALPPVNTDKEAIAEYEAARAAEAHDEDTLQGRLGQRKWIPGKSSIYVDAFNLALETVLDEEAHLFDEAEMALFNIWRELSYEGQYLSVMSVRNSFSSTDFAQLRPSVPPKDGCMAQNQPSRLLR